MRLVIRPLGWLEDSSFNETFLIPKVKDCLMVVTSNGAEGNL